MTRDGDQGDEPEGAAELDPDEGATELDVSLPDKIALSHEDGELEERETLPVVQLPDADQLERKKVPPVLTPMPEADRSTEVVDLPRFEEVKTTKKPPSHLLVLLGLLIGIPVTLLIIYFLVW
jgi:hypothetical protein